MKDMIVLIMLIALFAGGCSGWSDRIPKTIVKADKIIVLKSERKLLLLANGHILRTYKIALGRNPVGPKMKEGDGKTPEGLYIIDGRNPNSEFHLSLHISYPSALDRARARRAHVNPGGDIMIHGIRNGLRWIGPLHRMMDWTQGCIAVTDGEIDEIAALVPNGTPIEIRP